MNIIDFSQNMSQGLWDRDSPFLQLPGVDENKLKDISKKLKDTTFEQFFRLSATERKALGLFDEKELKNVEKAMQVFPLMNIEAKGYVIKAENFKDPKIISGDLLTIELAVKMPNLGKGKKRGYIHSNQFPYMRRDNFIVIITNADGSKILNYERVFNKENEFSWSMQFRTGEPMRMQLVAYLRSDA
jgi:translocation protein SEC63